LIPHVGKRKFLRPPRDLPPWRYFS